MMINMSGCCYIRVIFTKNLEIVKTKQIQGEIEFSSYLRKLLEKALIAYSGEFELNFNVIFSFHLPLYLHISLNCSMKLSLYLPI